MKKIPEQKAYTKEELIEKTAKIKKFSEKSGKGGKGGKIDGVEAFLDTDAGKVRVLTYGFESDEIKPLFINMHGGGFILGHPEMDDPYLLNVAHGADVKIINVDWSHAPEHPFPAAVNECYAVAKYAQEHADELRINPERISMGGHSAGGNFTAAVCIKNAETKELNLKCAILDYPPLNVYKDPFLKPRGRGFVARVFLAPKRARIFDACYCPDKNSRKNPLISPVFATTEQLEGFPPTLIFTAGKDSLCEEGEEFKDLLIKAGVDVTHKQFKNSPHGFTLSNKPEAKEAWQIMIDFLKKHLF